MFLFLSTSVFAEPVRFEFQEKHKNDVFVNTSFEKFNFLFKKLGTTKIVKSLRGHYYFQKENDNLWFATNQYLETITIYKNEEKTYIRIQSLLPHSISEYEIAFRKQNIVGIYEQTQSFHNTESEQKIK